MPLKLCLIKYDLIINLFILYYFENDIYKCEFSTKVTCAFLQLHILYYYYYYIGIIKLNLEKRHYLRQCWLEKRALFSLHGGIIEIYRLSDTHKMSSICTPFLCVLNTLTERKVGFIVCIFRVAQLVLWTRISIVLIWCFFQKKIDFLIFNCLKGLYKRNSHGHLNFRAGSTFPVPVVLALWTGLAGKTRLTRSDFMLHIGWIYFYQRGSLRVMIIIYIFICKRWEVVS